MEDKLTEVPSLQRGVEVKPFNYIPIVDLVSEPVLCVIIFMFT